MGRFLTPSKIALLVLAQIYTKGSIPFSGTARVLDVLISRILLDASEPHLHEHRQDQGSILDLEKALSGQHSAIPGRTVWDILLKDLWAIDCADALDWLISETSSQLIKTREELLKERDEGLPSHPGGRVIRTSPLGAFIRRCSLEYLRLQFQDSTSLWLDFVAYRLPSKAAFTKKSPRSLRNAFDINLADLDIDLSHPLASIIFRPLLHDAEDSQKSFSTYDSEKLMEFQVSEMQSFGGRLPENMKTRLQQMVEMGTSAPKLSHYLRFLDSWRAGDFTSAFDNLHRYFDYTMQSRERTFYQYALLNLAILQADFGCHEEAIPAMQEAIATARENRDTICLNYCLSWLYHFGRAFPAQMEAIRDTGILGNEVEGLHFLKSRAKEAEMWTLLSTSHLSEAKLALQHGESLAMCFENIAQAAHINIIKAVPNSTGPALLMKTTLFSRIGQAHMAQSCGERFLLCHMQEAPLEDNLKCTIRQANMLAQMGRISEAQNMLGSVQINVLKVLKYKTYHTTSALMLRARRLLYRNKLEEAGYIIERLVSQQPHPEMETSTHVSLLEVDLLMRRKELLSALGKVEALADKVLVENDDVLIKTKVMTIKAQLFARSDKAHSGFSLAMKAVDLSYRARALSALWEATLALTVILLASYEFVAAKDLMTAALPHVLECLDCDLAGRCYMLLADSYIGLAGLESVKMKAEAQIKSKIEQSQKNLISSAMEMLEKASEQFRWIQDLDGQLESLAKMSKVFAWRGDAGLAAETGEKYMSLRKQYEEEVI